MKISRSLLWQLTAALLLTMPAVAHPLDRGLAIVDPAVIEERDGDLASPKCSEALRPADRWLGN